MPKVSVIIPIFGVEKYIEKCAVSLFEQTIDDVEYLFVNDCTKDNSLRILNDVIQRYPNREKQIHILNHDCNKGLPIARQTGIREATGDYLYHCDSDDWLELDMLELLYDSAIENDVDIVYCDYYIAREQDNKVLHKESLSDNYCEDILKDKVSPNVWNKLCKRQLFNANIIYPSGNMGEDLTLMCQLAFFAQKIYYLPLALYNYRINPSSLTGMKSRSDALKKFNNLSMNYSALLEFMEKNNNPRLKRLLVSRLLRAKSVLYPYLKEEEIYKLWKNSFIGYHKQWVLSCYISPKEKLRYLFYYYGGKLI